MTDVERIPVTVYSAGERIAAILHRDPLDPLNDVLEYPAQGQQDKPIGSESVRVQAAEATGSA